MNFPEEKKEKQEEKKEEIKEEAKLNKSKEKNEIKDEIGEEEKNWKILLEDISSEDIQEVEKKPYLINLEGLFL